MAQLKDTIVSGSLRATDTIYTTTLLAQIINAPTASNGTTYGPGTNEYVLMSNGTSIYWGTGVSNAIKALDASFTGATNKTLTALTQTDGKITTATFNDIAINESQVTWSNNTLYTIGDDVSIGDVNVGGHLGVKGKNGNTGIMFTTYNQNTNTTGGKVTWDGSKFILTGTAPTLGTSNLGSARLLFYLNAGVPTNGNYVVSHFGNAGKSNMNDIGRLHASMGMTQLVDPSNTVDNPGNAISWHHYIDISYTDDPSGSNAWVTQFANKAGTTDLWMRSRSGGTITDGTAWTAPWVRVLTESNISNALELSGMNLLPNTLTMEGWSGTENRSETPFTWCYSHSIAKGSNSYADISYNSVFTPEPEEWYTLSYWAKASAATTINNFFYSNGPQCGYNCLGVNTIAADGAIAMTLTTEWKHYWVTWQARADVSGAKNIILARIQTNATVYIALPKLEKGKNATDWCWNPGDGLHLYGRTGNGDIIYNGGGGTATDYSLILHGNSTNGSSGIAFLSSKGNNVINYPSDRAFILFHPYGVSTYSTEGTAPTLATSGEAAALVIGVGNDAADTIHLLTPGRTGLYHQVANNYFTIPDTGNTTGTVGSSSLPVYVNAGVITAVTAKDTCNALINALDTGSSTLTANDYIITQYVGGGTTTTTYHRRPASAVRVGGLLTARKLKVALNSTTDATFDGTADLTSIPVSGTLGVANGGTGQASYTIGDILYASSASALSKLGGNTTITRKFLLSAATTSGTAVAPKWDTVTATDVGLSDVTNTAALNKNTGTKGDIIYWNAKDTPAHLGIGTNGYFLTVSSGAPAWSALPVASTGTTGIMKVGTGLSASSGTVSVSYGIAASTALQGNLTLVTLNGTNKNASSVASFYAPTSAGTSGQYLKSSGSGAPTWANLPTLSATASGSGNVVTAISASNHAITYTLGTISTVSAQIIRW